MRVFFGVIGAVIGVSLGIWFLGELVGTWIVGQQSLQSPDDAASGSKPGLAGPRLTVSPARTKRVRRSDKSRDWASSIALTASECLGTAAESRAPVVVSFRAVTPWAGTSKESRRAPLGPVGSRRAPRPRSSRPTDSAIAQVVSSVIG